MKNGSYILVIASENYPGKKYRDRYCYEHHLVYWKETGIIPKKGEIIHHKDENKTNNNFSNLKLIYSSEHNKIHSSVAYLTFKCNYCKKVNTVNKQIILNLIVPNRITQTKS